MKKWVVVFSLVFSPAFAQQARDWDTSDQIRIYQQLLAEANDRLTIANARIDQLKKQEQLKELEKKPETDKK